MQDRKDMLQYPQHTAGNTEPDKFVDEIIENVGFVPYVIREKLTTEEAALLFRYIGKVMAFCLNRHTNNLN